MFVFDLATRRGCFGNPAAAALMGTTGPNVQQLLQLNLAELAGVESAARIEQGLAALTSGAVRSYQGERSYPDCNGKLIHAQHTVTRLDLCGAAPAAVGVVSRPVRQQRGARSAASVAPALVTLDHHWRVDAVGPDVEPRLGLGPTDLLGGDVRDHVHPEDRQELVEAFELASVAETVTTRVGMRVGEEWRAADLLVGALCQHRRPRLGMLVAFHCDARSASEAASPAPGETAVFGGQPLSVPQQEVVARLLRGESIATMAAGMHLSRSTIRNHLCAVYAKAGVHSQAELIARFTGRHAIEPRDPLLSTRRQALTRAPISDPGLLISTAAPWSPTP